MIRVQTILAHLALTAAPALATMAVGFIGAGFHAGPAWLPVALGALIALPLLLAGALVTALSKGVAMHLAAYAAVGALMLRVGGATIAAFALAEQPHASAMLLSMVACLVAALAVEAGSWLHLAHRLAPRASAVPGDSARA